MKLSEDPMGSAVVVIGGVDRVGGCGVMAR